VTLAIDVSGLDKHFGDKHVVQNVSIQVEEGPSDGSSVIRVAQSQLPFNKVIHPKRGKISRQLPA